MIWAASQYGGVGAGYVWLGMNLLSFVAWLPLVHHRFEPGLNLKWYGEDVLLILLPLGIVGYELRGLISLNNNRLLQIAEILTIGMAVLFAGLLASSEARRCIK
jgi:tellurite resistance protein TehA-like permease